MATREHDPSIQTPHARCRPSDGEADCDGTNGGRGSGLAKASTIRSLSLNVDSDDDHALLAQVADHYHRALLESSEASAWLARRGLESPDLATRFKLGFANRTLGLRIPQKNRRAGATIRARLQRLGVLRASGHEALNGCIVVPLVDDEGRVVQLYGHRIAEGLPRATSPHVWLRDDPRGLFDRGACDGGDLVVATSVLDALTRGSIHDSDGLLEVSCLREKSVVEQTLETENAAAVLTPVADADTSHAPMPAANADEHTFAFGDRRWRIRGLATNKARGTLRLNVLVSREHVGFHVDVFDLCSSRHRTAFVRMASDELRIDEQLVKKDLGTVLLALEDAHDELLRRAHEPAANIPVMTEAEQTAALDLLRDPHLLDRVLTDLERIGVVGERDNLLLAYLATVSRKLAEPLAVVVQSSSAAGKSSLLHAVLSLVPPEDRVVYSALTGQSLYYMGSKDLRHKVLCVAEDRGVERASYALKLLQSDGALTIASTGKDPGSGRLVSQEYRVEGPVAIMMTTTAAVLDDELLSRCLILAVDESPEQTRKIHASQRADQTRDGLVAREHREHLLALHHNAQRLLRPVRVVNPHTGELAFPDLRVRARRDHRKLLALVEVIAMLHQHQRPSSFIEESGQSFEVVEAQRADLELAQRLSTLVTPGLDELPHHTLRLLDGLDTLVDERAHALGIHRDHVRFSRRDVRTHTAVSDTQLKVHLRRLVDAELVLVHAARESRRVVYSLAFGCGAYEYDPNRSVIGRASVGPRSGFGRASVGA